MTTIYHHETLDLDTWFDRLARLVESLRDGSDDLARYIRKAYHLQCLAPDALRPMVTTAIDEARLEQLLDQEGFEAAVIGVIGASVPKLVEEVGCTDFAPGMTEVDPALKSRSIVMLLAWAVGIQRRRPAQH